jgi:pimeloyl-ACP methyl ester carboxylesterase
MSLFRRWGLFALGWTLVLAGGLLAHLIQTSGGVTVTEVRYAGASGETLAALLYTPPGLSAAHPAPAILASHGYINTREMQSPFAIELARRGFVVLAIDMAGHGYSGGAVGTDDGGGPDGLKYLQGLPFVNRDEIGLEGHSMGGVPVIGAALAQPQGYRSMVLEGSTTPEIGQIGAPSPTFPRNVQVVFGGYDEFAPLMWRESEGARVGQSPKMMALFGQTVPVTPGQIYGDIDQGSARRLIIPPVTHPMEHFSAAGVGAAVDWFQRTLSGEASPKPPTDQIWLWKDVGTLIALIGFAVLVLGTFHALAPRLKADPPTPAGPWRWTLGVLATAALPAATFYPLMGLGFAFFPSRLFPEWVANQLAVWVLVNAALGLIIALVLRQGRPRWSGGLLRPIAFSLASAAMGYLAILVCDAAFKTDFRFWVVGLKPLDRSHALNALAYLPIFLLAFLAMQRGLIAGLVSRRATAFGQYATGVAAMSAGFVVLLAWQYGSLMTTGRLASPTEALNTIIAIQFVPILAFIGVVGVFTWRRTGGYVAGALLCAVLVTWYITAGTATHWRPGWSVPHNAGLFPDRPAATGLASGLPPQSPAG